MKMIICIVWIKKFPRYATFVIMMVANRIKGFLMD